MHKHIKQQKTAKRVRKHIKPILRKWLENEAPHLLFKYDALFRHEL